MASATFSESAQIDSAPGDVWSRLHVPSIWVSVGPVQKVWDSTFDDGGLRNSKWSTNIGGRVYDGVGRALGHDRPHRYVLDLNAGEMAGKISTNLTAGNPGGTTVEVSIELRSKGMMSSLFIPAIKNAVGSRFLEQVAETATQLATS